MCPKRHKKAVDFPHDDLYNVKIRTRTKIEKGEKMCEFDEKLENAHMGRLIHMLSHQMKRNSNGMESVIENDELTVM